MTSISAQVRPVVFQPDAAEGLRRGIRQIVHAIRPTLGPGSRVVAIAPVMGNGPPELLDDGGLIARRITDLPERDADMGAMLLRGMLWRLHEEMGDGTATAAVLFEAVFEGGLRYLAAGGNAMRLRDYLGSGLNLLLDELSHIVLPVGGREELVRLARSLGADPPLAEMLGEIFDVIGEWGHLTIRSGYGRDLEREYVEGMHWRGGVLSSHLLKHAQERETGLENPAIFVSDATIDEPDQLLPLLELARQEEIRALMIIVRQLSDPAVGLLVRNQQPGAFEVVAVHVSDADGTQQGMLEDVARLTGGTPLLMRAGDSLRDVRREHFGRARRAWASREYAGIVAGKGDPRELRRHLASLRNAFAAATDPEAREQLSRRIGRLLGGSATLWIGGATKPAMQARKSAAERTASALRGAIRDGTLPGGGAALLSCREPLRCAIAGSTNPDERAAYQILFDALDAPARQIAVNAGYDASSTVGGAVERGRGHGLDVVTGTIVDTAESGIVDPAGVQIAALRSAVSTAALALTIDVLVHHRKPEEVLTP
jgi:chaperonin GroEL